MQEYTELSAQAMRGVSETGESPGAAVRFFTGEMVPRGFDAVLRALLESRGLTEAQLVERLEPMRPELKRDSLRRRVSSWLSGRGQPGGREELAQLSFALGLGGEEAGELLASGGEGGFHLREPREAAWLYGLRAGRSWQQTQALIGRLPNVDGPFPADEGDPAVFTRTLSDRLARVRTDEDFLRFYEENLPDFGRLHNTAYRYFLRFLGELTRPGAPCEAPEEEAYSVERAVDTYLRLNMPLSRGTGSYSQLQKAIKRFWPNATAVKNMLARRADVGRKTLLLLYLATEGLDDGAIEESLGWEPASPDELLEEHVWNLNLMLHECGLGRLDPRSPFDWLVLYSLRTGEGGESMSDRLSQVLALLFPEDGQQVDAAGGAP